MKRYLLFVGWEYYPTEGWNTFRIDCDSADDCMKIYEHDSRLNTKPAKWYQIVDTFTKQIVKEFYD